MKTVSNDLFLLIKSLNMNEKGYFRKFCKAYIHKGDTEYLELFEALDNTEEYNEAAFLKLHQGKKFTSHFAARKHYLQNTLYKSLQHYYANATIDAQIRNLLSTAEIICYKGLFKQSLHLLSKAEKLSIKHNRECFLMEITDLKVSLSLIRMDVKELKNIMPRLLPATDEQISRLRKRRKLQFISLKIFEDIESRGVFWEHELERSKMHEKELLKMESDDEYKFLSVHVLQALSMLHSNAQNKSKRLTLREKQYKLYEADESLIDENLNRYLGCLWALCQIHASNGDYGKMDACIAKITGALDKYQLGSTNYFQGTFLVVTYFLKLGVFLHQGKYTDGLELIPVVTELMKKYDLFIREDHKMIFKTHFALLYFIGGNFKDSQFWIQNILNEHTKIRKDILLAVRLLNIMVHFELKNYKYLNNLLIYTEKKARSEGKQSPFLVSFIKKLGNQLDQLSGKTANSKILWQELKDYVVAIEKKDEQNRILLDMIGLHQWIESKLINKPLHEIYSQNLKSKARTK